MTPAHNKKYTHDWIGEGKSKEFTEKWIKGEKDKGFDFPVNKKIKYLI